MKSEHVQVDAVSPYAGPHSDLWELGLQSIRELEAERGILASGRHEVYGCVFGRDSLITSLALLNVYKRTGNVYFLDVVRKVLHNLADLQGRDINIESGEEPGKCIHEYRPDNHERLTVHAQKPWYVYPDNQMRNYDTVDATPLFLMTLFEYVRVSGDTLFGDLLEANARTALQWMLTYGDSNGDGFLDYQLHPERTHGGLATQSWMDSEESVFFEEHSAKPRYPIAPVEVQAYAYVALRSWSAYFLERDAELSRTLARRADTLKKKFNEHFVLYGMRRSRTWLASAIDGSGQPLSSARSSMGHVLWAVWRSEPGAMPESILDDVHIPRIARRLLMSDLYVPQAGIRTLSSRSRAYDPHSYHNGSIWPHDTAIVAEGLENFGFREEARRVRRGLVAAYSHFKTPLELFVYKGGYRQYSQGGQDACKVQAWSAASLLTVIHEESTVG